jgi:PAS domain S-box-containing protein
VAQTAQPRRIDEETALRAVIEGTASETGVRFYRALVQNLARALDTHGAWVTEYLPERASMRALAFWFDGRFVDEFEYETAGTPCEAVIHQTGLIHIPERAMELYAGPAARGFPKFATSETSYLGMPLLDTDGRVMGHVAVVDVRPMPAEKRLLPLFEIFATRAAAEMRRLRLEMELREGRERLGRLIDGTMDAIVEFDRDLRVTLVNAAAEKAFGCTAGEIRGQGVDRLLGATATRTLSSLARELEERPGNERSLWIPSGLTAEPPGGRAFPAEATLSRYEAHGQFFHTLILRNVDERIEAERCIQNLCATTEYLRAEIEADHGFDEIIGRSPSLRLALQSVAQVAATDATVLILGETGTGKELFARAIHKRSPRRDKPLIKVNCAAIPTSLIESEFFGHERGAFTGATQRREGRFALADGGTIFLDEISELPLELQGKLLRVLQEGEFEAVGSSRTRKVDVRVMAATNRELEREVEKGAFREDLYYRLSVFPLRLPPLRERGDDVALIATATLEKLARRMGVCAAPLSAADVATLRSYAWPGNVRELRNVLERALITSKDGRIQLERVLPVAATPPPAAAAPAATAGEILTARRVRQLESANMLAALERAGWRVGGADGAAELLGLSPSTFKSRMKALNIQRPAG